jgi:TRAP-type C4-dicarboxylate transport system permease small subunit
MIKRISDAVNRICESGLILFLSAMAVVVFLEVIFRYLIRLPLFWTEELARYCLVWASLLGASVALKKGEHIAITLFTDRLPKRAGLAFEQAAHISVAFILAVMLWGGVALVFITRSQISPALRIPMAFPYMALPVSSGIMLLHVITAVISPPGKTTTQETGQML